MFNDLERLLTYSAIFGFLIPLPFVLHFFLKFTNGNRKSLFISFLCMIMFLSALLFLWLSSINGLRFH